MSMIEIDFVSLIAQVGFPIAVSVYLLYERSKAFTEHKAQIILINGKYEEITKLLLEVIKGNTAAQTDLRATIQKLCEIVNSGKR